MKVYKDGFTLIELLVVIGIIVLLASLIAVAVMREAKIRSLIGSIEANLTQVRQIAASIMTESGSYVFSGNSLCGNDGTLDDTNVNHPEIKDIETEVQKRNGNNPVNCLADATRYCVYTSLPDGNKICLDYTGVVKKGSYTCSGTSLTCQ